MPGKVSHIHIYQSKYVFFYFLTFFPTIFSFFFLKMDDLNKLGGIEKKNGGKNQVYPVILRLGSPSMTKPCMVLR